MAQQVTHPFAGHDGFGEQVKLAIFTMMWAELSSYHYVYTPFSQMAHNYHDDPDFVAKKEAFLGWYSHFARENALISQASVAVPRINVFDLLHFVSTHMAKCAQTSVLARVRDWFWQQQQHPRKTSKFRIVLHIRQPNAHDRHASSFAIPLTIYAEILQHLQRLYGHVSPQIEIVSQTPGVDFANTTCYCDETVEDAFLRMASADVLVVGPSAFSYAAALLADPQKTIVYYIAHCNPPLPNWHVIQNYESPRMRYEYIIPLTVWFDATRNSFLPGLSAAHFPNRLIRDLARYEGCRPEGAPDRLPFNGNPEFAEICAHYLRAYKIDMVIETGTYVGHTTEFFAQHCAQVHSIETNVDYWTKACATLATHTNVQLHLGDSAQLLPKILVQVQKTNNPRILFYLDAHWQEQCPLLSELKAIAENAHTRNNCFVIIDDFCIPHRPDIPFDTYVNQPLNISYVRETLQQAIPDLHYEYYAPLPHLAQTRGRLIAYPTTWENQLIHNS